MGRQSSSCVRRCSLGCGCFVSVIVIIAGLFIFSLETFEPEEPRFATREVKENFTEGQGQGLDLYEEVPDDRPIEVVMNFNGAMVDITSSNEGGPLEVHGQYDEANFTLKTELEEDEDSITYYVSFENKRSVLSFLYRGHLASEQNRIFVKLPQGRVLDLDITAKNGNSDIDLGGLSVSDLEINAGPGNLSLSCSEANPIPLEKMDFNAQMGIFRVNDLQNYRFTDGSFDAKMGELILANSGDFLDREVSINMLMSLGHARIELPRSAKVISDDSSEGGQLGGSDKLSTLVELNGGVSFGDHTVTYRTRKPSIERLIKRLFREYESPEVAMSHVRKIFRENPDRYDHNEDLLNNLGYSLMRKKAASYLARAIEVFKFNIEIHPEYANGYDSLGEGYLTAGFIEQAVNNYEKSLELNPNNYNGKRMLHKLKQASPPAKLTKPEPVEPLDPGDAA